MKASLKFREDQKPLLRAKVPITILGMPFQSGVVAGDSKELTLNLATLFESGPSVKFSYRPNDTWSPFSLSIKTGTGSYGSPRSGSLLMSAEFNLLGRGDNPRFMLHFKPRFGDFSIKKSQSSDLVKAQNGVVSGGDSDSSVEVVDAPVGFAGFAGVNGIFAGKRFTVLPSEFPDARSISGVLSGMQVSARTAIPIKGRDAVNLRWGVRVPAEGKLNLSSLPKIPFLVMNKIGIEHVCGHDDSKEVGQGSGGLDADVAETCRLVKRQLEFLEAQNGTLRKAVEDLRREVVAGDLKPAGGKSDRRSGDKGKLTEGDVDEGFKKVTGS